MSHLSQSIESHIGFRHLSILGLLWFSCAICSIASAEDRSAMTSTRQRQLVESICHRVQQLYPFPEAGAATIDSLRRKLETGKYASWTDPTGFAAGMTADLEGFSGDRHFDLSYDPQMAVEMKKDNNATSGDVYRDSMAERLRWANYGFRELRILDGNIGYMDLRFFAPLNYAAETAIAAVSYFANSDALIIDLRQNGGGWDEMVMFLLSYFVDTKDPLIMTITQSTLDKSYEVSGTFNYVPGRRLLQIPVYLLVSSSTGSAAEAFAYRMQYFKRATLIGETTSGAEHPVEMLALDDEFVLTVPCWKRLFSITGSGWEATGVSPDVAVDSGQAFDVAYQKALEVQLSNVHDDTQLFRVNWALDGLRARAAPVTISHEIAQSYVGTYGERTIILENDRLQYQRTGPKYALRALSEVLFQPEGLDYFRIRFVRDSDGRVTGLVGLYDDGRADPSPRTE
ncbi:hypothetical protein JXA88_16665 [Candidatus Fermentibacteria bacterium]|nr:hypothetical protein [Candidatus Fermentibacteria bacterium]